MLQKIHLKIQNTYKRILNSMALYPALITFLFFVLAVAMIPTEYSELGVFAKKKLGFVLVEGSENARTILGILISGIISLTVFSFSMVMIVLNRASSTLSPRIIPGLITQKFHQIVLGFYLGSIVYSMIVIVNINKNQQNYETPSLSVLLAMCFGIISLGLFVYFIHSISQSIQVDNILNKIFHETDKELDKLYKKQGKDLKDFTAPHTENWFEISNVHPGYFKSLQQEKLKEISQKEDLELHIQIKRGHFTVKGYPYVLTSKTLEEKPEVIDQIHSCFNFYMEEFVTDHYSYGFKQITEIAVKALSPGINDPGTAVKAIDLLSILFMKKMRLEEFDFVADKKIRITSEDYNMEDLLYDSLTPIRAYGKKDALVMINLLEAFKNMAYSAQNKVIINNKLSTQVKSTIVDIDENIQNHLDRSQINKMLKALNKHLPVSAQVNPLKVNHENVC